jgi:hypothetical protein
MELYLQGGIGVGEALQNARNKFFADSRNPLGLAFAYFGSADLQLKYS